MSVLIAAIIAAVVGWRLFWFLTDDAFIAFRYVANSMKDLGFVWNPPPFEPVEGYTSFLWVAVLRGVWTVTGIEPPVAANYLSLACGLGTLALVYALFLRMSLPQRLERYRLALGALVLLGTISNRTFLAWLSSGLETALFNLLFTWWVYEALTTVDKRNEAWFFRLASAAGLLALARPDGLLSVAATVGIAGTELVRHRAVSRRHLLAALPLLIAPAHLLWRRITYGEWLPNTYYAKFVEAWPESGVRYAASFMLEYGVWLWLLLAVAWLLLRARAQRSEWLAMAPPVAAIAVLLAHFGYYTFVIGGDHFEYRVYSHLVPLLWTSFVWLAARMLVRPRAIAFATVAFLVAASPIPWVHWAKTHDLTTRDYTFKLAEPIADEFPWPIRPIVQTWDDWQGWLIARHVGNRHQEHKVFYESQGRRLPRPEAGALLPWWERHVIAERAVGLLGWRLSDVAIIDLWGLNDRVIARTPIVLRPGRTRMMAHDRSPPAGYVECFRPDVRLDPTNEPYRFWVTPRESPLDDEEIRRCERRRWTAPAAE